jgi:polyferredoxin
VFALYLVAGFVIYALLGASREFALFGIVVGVALLLRDTWFCKLCPAGVLEGGVPWIVLDPALRDLVGALFWVKVTILVLFVAWMTVTQRPFCRWACPLGAIWSPLNRLSTLRMAVDGETCIRCDRCQEVCPVDIRIYQDSNSPKCIRCMECVAVCPVSCVSVRGS